VKTRSRVVNERSHYSAIAEPFVIQYRSVTLLHLYILSRLSWSDEGRSRWTINATWTLITPHSQTRRLRPSRH